MTELLQYSVSICNVNIMSIYEGTIFSLEEVKWLKENKTTPKETFLLSLWTQTPSLPLRQKILEIVSRPEAEGNCAKTNRVNISARRLFISIEKEKNKSILSYGKSGGMDRNILIGQGSGSKVLLLSGAIK